MAASLRPVFLCSEHWFLCVSILESEVEKQLKFGSQIAQEVFCEPEFHVASASVGTSGPLRPLLNPLVFMWNTRQLHPLAETYPLLPGLLQWPPKGFSDSSLSLLEPLLTEGTVIFPLRTIKSNQEIQARGLHN